MGDEDHAGTLSVEGLSNARDLGGRRRADGSRTPHGVFFRSENLDAVTPAGWQHLHTLGIRTVVDLRQPSERSRLPYDPPAWATVLHVDHDGLDEHPDFWAGYWDNGMVGTALYYEAHLRRLPERSAAVLRALAQAPEGGVLFHCMSGRDRTGIIAMLLLRIAGVVPEEIVDDYLASVRNADAMAAARGRPDEERAREALCRAHGTTTEGAFRDVVAGVDPAWATDLLDPDARTALRTWRGALR